MNDMLTNVCRRRTFLGGVGAAFGSAILPATAFAKAGEPIMRFGVASDVHIAVGWKEGGDPERLGLRSQPYFLEKALRWFDANKADAVVFSGDMAHTGRMEELEKLVEVWNKVFPGMKRSDGEKVERMLVTGNHEIGQWPGLWSRYTDEQLRKIRFDYDREHVNANWRKLFGEDYQLIWKREVKGITFVGAHYPRGMDYQKGWHRPDYSGFFAAHAAELRQNTPFFYVQHGHPAHTCYGEDARNAWPDRSMHRILADFPNAVALSGHSHNTPIDDRSVWQGRFTSIGCGAVAEAGPSYRVFNYDNGGAPYWPSYKNQRMLCPPQTGNDGRNCVLFEVYADHLVMKAWSLAFDCPLCEDRAIALPPIPGGEYDFTRRAESRPAPQFSSDAKATVEFAVNPQYCGPGLKGKPCAVVKFPCARPQEGGGKVFDYVINALVDGRQVLRTYILNRGYYLPGDRSFTEGVSILGRHELPKGKEVVFSITPRDCYRVCGDELLTAPVVVNP